MEPDGGWSEYDLTAAMDQHGQDDEDEDAAVSGRHVQRGDAVAAAAGSDIMKPLVRRRLRHQRDLAHSLVGTPNYIAPEVLARTGTSRHRHTHTRAFNGPLSGTTRVSRYQKGKTNLDFTEARGSGINWAICKSAPRSRQITMPAPHHSVFYRPDALPAAQPTVSRH